MQDIEQQRFEQRRVVPHGLEVEDLNVLYAEGVVDVIEEGAVSAAVDPLAQTGRQRARQEVREREQASLARLQHV